MVSVLPLNRARRVVDDTHTLERWRVTNYLRMWRNLTIMDIVSPDQRSRMMAGIRGKSTKPELIVRRTAHQLGYRFRLHRKDLPGSPDLVFPRMRLVIFVNGCFWHRHENCRFAYNPKTNIEFWTRKFKNNVLRDKKAKEGLEAMGWRVAVIWECETANAVELRKTLRTILAS